MPDELSARDIKKLRSIMQMTQKEFSEAFDISISTLRHWERGDRKPQGAALILLQLIDASPGTIQGILNIKRSSKMAKSAEKLYLKKIVVEDRLSSFEDALVSTGVDIDKIIKALIQSHGIPHCDSKTVDSEILFYAGHDPSSLREVLKYDNSQKSISGELENTLPKAFSLISSIEHELSEAMYFPPELRKSQIESAISSAGADDDFYSVILKNW